MMLKVLSNTLETDILQTNICFYAGIRPECNVCELRYRPIDTMFLIQEYNLVFPIPKKNVILKNYHILFQKKYIFLVNSSNLMDTIKTIFVLIE